MTDDFTPPTDPFGARQPPGRVPPTAVGTDTPEPEDAPYRRVQAARIQSNPLRMVFHLVAGAVRGVQRALQRL
jgi:hypothetical protein